MHALDWLELRSWYFYHDIYQIIKHYTSCFVLFCFTDGYYLSSIECGVYPTIQQGPCTTQTTQKSLEGKVADLQIEK